MRVLWAEAHLVSSSFWDLSDSAAFTGALLSHLEARQEAGRSSELASALLDVLNLDARIAMQGFSDVFYQMLTAERCRAVVGTLREMGLLSLSTLFAEAFTIYCRGNTEISERDFALLEPFSLDGAAGARFNEIATLFAAPDSQLYRMCEAVHQFALQRRIELE
jgi:hypothetical protein